MQKVMNRKMSACKWIARQVMLYQFKLHKYIIQIIKGLTLHQIKKNPLNILSSIVGKRVQSYTHLVVLELNDVWPKWDNSTCCQQEPEEKERSWSVESFLEFQVKENESQKLKGKGKNRVPRRLVFCPEVATCTTSPHDTKETLIFTEMPSYCVTL